MFVFFTEAVEISNSIENFKHFFKIPKFNIQARAASAEKAKEKAALILWLEAERWLHMPSHKLTEEEMERKGLILGSLDLIKSKIITCRRNCSVMGRIEKQPDGRFLFRESTTEGKLFEISEELKNNLPQDNYIRIGVIKADDYGHYFGPIYELGEPLDNEPEETIKRFHQIINQQL